MAKFLTEAERMRIISGMKLTDNLFFTKCFSENPECVDLMLRIILGRDDLKVMRTSGQEWVVNLGRHSAILDILAEDSNGDVISYMRMQRMLALIRHLASLWQT